MDSRLSLPYESTNHRDQRDEISRVCRFGLMGLRRVAPSESRCAGGFEDIARPRSYSRPIRLVAEPAGSQKQFQLRNSFLSSVSIIVLLPRRPVPKCKRGAVGPFISAVNGPAGQLANIVQQLP